MGDAHQVIVDHDREVIRRKAVALHEHLHVHLRPGDLDHAAQAVFHPAGAVPGHAQADHRRFAGGQAPVALFFGHAQTVPVVAGVLPPFALGAAQGVQALGGAETMERVALGDEALGVLAVKRHPFALAVRAVRAADVRTLVPVDAGPAQGRDDGRLRRRRGTRLVGVLDAQHEAPAVATGESEIEERDVRRADVGVARGRRCDTRTDGQTGVRHAGRRL